jgi:hypothetical protein
MNAFDVLEASMGLLDPVMSMTMLDGLNQTLSSVKYDTDGTPIASILQSLLGSYVAQGVPTALGAVARTIDDTRRTNFTPSGQSGLESTVNRWWQSNVLGKIPVASENRMAYVDEWGRTDTTGSIAFRALENFLLPGYVNEVQTTPLDSEISRLAEATDNSAVYPDRATKYFMVDGEKYVMDQNEYEEHLVYRGQKSYSLASEVISSASYAKLDDETRAEAISLTYEYVSALAKRNTAEDYAMDKWMTKLADLEDQGGDAAEYLILKAQSKTSGQTMTEQVLQSAASPADTAEILLMEADSAPKSFTDPYTSGYEYVLDTSQQAHYTQLYRELYTDAYLELAGDDEYRQAALDDKKELLSELKKQVNAQVKEDMADWLWEQGIQSTEKD